MSSSQIPVMVLIWSIPSMHFYSVIPTVINQLSPLVYIILVKCLCQLHIKYLPAILVVLFFNSCCLKQLEPGLAELSYDFFYFY